MKSLKNCLTLFFCTITFSCLLAQNQKKINQTYEKRGYKEAIKLLEQKESKTPEDIERIANGYRLNHDTQKAELWYSQLINVSDDPLPFLYYAQALQSNGKLEDAKNYFMRYHSRVGGMEQDNRGQHLAEAIDRMNEFKKSEVVIRNERTANSDKLDYSPAFYKNGIVFVSSRKSSSAKQGEVDQWIDDHFMSLFFTEKKESGRLGSVKEFSKELNSKYHEGPSCFSKNGEQIFFTRNDFKQGKKRKNKKGIMKLEIFTSVKESEGWSEPRALNFNTKEYEECHPSINASGDQLFFASDRPGGRGGMDLYYVKFENGNWSEPINLGPEVNTPGNEGFPFIHDNGTLYFSSDGWGGIGGLDIFSTAIGMDSLWSKPQNIGTPFNSPKDDFGFILNLLGTEGYFSSAREGSKGKDDIYSFVQPIDGPKETDQFRALITVADATTGELIEGVQLVVIEKSINEVASLDSSTAKNLRQVEEEDKELLQIAKTNLINGESSLKTNQQGGRSYDMTRKKKYIILAHKTGYSFAEKEVSTFGKTDQKEMMVKLLLTKKECLSLNGTIRNQTYGNNIPNADITLIDLCTGDEIELTSDEEGNFLFPCIPCGCDFIVKGSKEHFKSEQVNLTTIGKSCNQEDGKKVLLNLSPKEGAQKIDSEEWLDKVIENPIVQNIQINVQNYEVVPANKEEIREPVTVTESYNEPKIDTPTSPESEPTTIPSTTSLKESTLESRILNDAGAVAIGRSIEMKNIYYAYNRYRIRSWARLELKKIARLMNQYPSMILELSAHTDSRGDRDFNQELSQNRADAAVKYLTKLGIDPARLVAVGYGESQPRNNCTDGVDCTEEDHQYNRRTEIKVLHIDNPNLNIEYIDNQPKVIAGPKNIQPQETEK